MKKVTENQKRDHALFFVEKGDPGFSPAYNKFVIEESIKKYEANRKRKMKEFVDDVGERSDAVASFLVSKHAQYSVNPSLEKYFGRSYLAYLRGEEIADTIRTKMNMVRKMNEMIVK